MASVALRPFADATDRRAVAGWILYDLANVIFSMNIVSLYFPLWVVDNAGGRDAHVGIANGVAMGLVFCVAPFLGIIADRSGRRLPYLAVSTVLCCVLTLFLGQGGLITSLIIFVAANTVFSCGLVFYDALLPVVSTDATRGRISGFGMGAGFAGALIGVAAGAAILATDAAAKPTVFQITAFLFFIGSIPCFLWLREPPRQSHTSFSEALRLAKRDLRGSVERARSMPGMPRFLIGRVFYTDAANTLFAFMGIYATKEVGFSDGQAQLILATGILTGPIGALVAGSSADRIGPKRTLDRLLVLWTVVLTLCAAIPAFNLPRDLFWLVAPLGGIAFGGTGTTDRALLLKLAPSRRVGECFGLFAMVGRFSAILGPLLWALEVDGLSWGRPAAIATLTAMVLISLFAFRKIDERSGLGEIESIARPN